MTDSSEAVPIDQRQESRIRMLITGAKKERARRILAESGSNDDRATIMLDGVATNSCDRTNLESLRPALGGFSSSVLFSYSDVGLPYDIEQTVKAMGPLSEVLTKHAAHFPENTRLCLLGYSLGGLVIGHWLTRTGLRFRDRIDRVILIASPVWATVPPSVGVVESDEDESQTPADYPSVSESPIGEAATESGKLSDDELLTMVTSYGFEWQKFRANYASKTLVVKCLKGKDRIIYSDWMISFKRTNSAVKEVEIPGADHFTICTNLDTIRAIRNWLMPGPFGSL